MIPFLKIMITFCWLGKTKLGNYTKKEQINTKLKGKRLKKQSQALIICLKTLGKL